MVLMKANPSLFVLLALLTSPVSHADVVSDLTGRAEKGDAGPFPLPGPAPRLNRVAYSPQRTTEQSMS